MADETKTKTTTAALLEEHAAPLRAQFWALLDEKEAIEAKSKPHHDKRDAIRAQIQALQADYDAETAAIQAIEKPRLFEIDNERGEITRRLRQESGKAVMGERPAKKAG